MGSAGRCTCTLTAHTCCTHRQRPAASWTAVCCVLCSDGIFVVLECAALCAAVRSSTRRLAKLSAAVHTNRVVFVHTWYDMIPGFALNTRRPLTPKESALPLRDLGVQTVVLTSIPYLRVPCLSSPKARCCSINSTTCWYASGVDVILCTR